MTVPSPENYELIRPLGVGGMGEVHLARDLALDREVAVKFLSKDLADSEEFRSRFEREARSAAGLSHPGIVTIHAISETGGRPFIAMEYVEGRTLTQAIPPEGLPLPRLLDLGCQLAEAVAAAHESGLTHRDLKPDNVMLSSGDRVKVLDFGLAKRSDARALPAGSDVPIEERPTVAGPLTAAHEVVGTVTYMSPEQAEGREVDGRSDVFSLGVVLYEMATGVRPFGGESSVSVLSAILRDDPQPIGELRDSLPPGLWRIVRRCLEKDVTRRFQTARDVANELADLRDGRDQLEASTPGTGTSGLRWGLLAGGLAGGLLLGLLAGRLLGVGATAEARAGELAVGAVRQLTTHAELELFPSLMPNASAVAYAARRDGQWNIELLRVGGRNAIELTAEEPADDTQPALSPDGQSIAFRSERLGGGLFVMGATGESVRRLTDFGFNPSWSPDGERIAFATESVTLPYSRQSGSALHVVDLDGGAPQRLLAEDAVQPSWSPKGDRIAFWGLGEGGNRDLFTIPAAGGEPVRVTTHAAMDWNPVWTADGSRLLFSSDRSGAMAIWSVAIDASSGAASSPPRPLTTGGPTAQLHLSPARDGSAVALVERRSRSNVLRYAFDPEQARVLGEPVAVTRGSVPFGRPDSSRDGARVVMARTEGREDLFVASSDGSRPTQLTDDAFKDRIPRWSPIDDRIAFFSNRGGSYDIWLIDADGSDLRQLTDSPGVATIEPLWSPDGRRLGYVDTGRPSFAILDLTRPDAEPTRVDAEAFGGRLFLPHDWSSDDRVVGSLRETNGVPVGLGVYDLRAAAFTPLLPRGDLPVWLDGARVLYLDRGALHLLDEDGVTRPVLEPTAPASLLHFSLSGDGRTLHVTQLEEDADLWLMELSAGAPGS